MKQEANNNPHDKDDEDVVFIEQRDRRSYLYIGIAAVLGIALGGLIGSALTSHHWEGSYATLENSIEKMNKDSSSLLAEANAKNKTELEKMQNAYEEQFKSLKEQNTQQVAALTEKLKLLETQKQDLEAQLSSQKTTLKTVESKNERLNQQADMQASVFERSRELFQKELKIKQQIESLEKEKSDLTRKLKPLGKECDAYLEGTSWDAHSDSCNKQDEANSRISQINQLLKVHQMDLKEIKALTNNLGLE